MYQHVAYYTQALPQHWSQAQEELDDDYPRRLAHYRTDAAWSTSPSFVCCGVYCQPARSAATSYSLQLLVQKVIGSFSNKWLLKVAVAHKNMGSAHSCS